MSTPVKTTGGAMKRTSIELPDDLHRQLKVMSAETNRPMNALMVEAIDSFVKSKQEETKE